MDHVPWPSRLIVSTCVSSSFALLKTLPAFLTRNVSLFSYLVLVMLLSTLASIDIHGRFRGSRRMEPPKFVPCNCLFGPCCRGGGPEPLFMAQTRLDLSVRAKMPRRSAFAYLTLRFSHATMQDRQIKVGHSAVPHLPRTDLWPTASPRARNCCETFYAQFGNGNGAEFS
jgi:hypothetical protein